MKNSIFIFFLLMLFGLSSWTSAGLPSIGESEPAEPPARKIVFILDGSGSMWQKVEGEYKIVLARKVLSDLLRELPDDYQVGLVVYGHREKGDCRDIETLISVSDLDLGVFNQKLSGINPLGKTPIASAIRHSVKSLDADSGNYSIVLISDGLETCEGDPCLEVKLAREQNSELVFNVIGFGLEADDASSLECTAQEGGGLYYDARDARQLADALRSVVIETAAVAEAYLSVKAIKNDLLEDVGIRVYRAGTDEEIAFGRTYVTANTNPRILALPSGNVDILIRSIHLKGDVLRTFKNQIIASGDTLYKEIDFSPGTLEVGVTRNGELSDAVVTVYGSSDRQEITKSRSYRGKSSNPVIFEITPGMYEISIGSVEIRSSPEKIIKEVEVRARERISVSHNFESGIYNLGATRGDELIDVVLSIQDFQSGKEVAKGRTYRSENSNPKEFVLLPGKYKVEMKAIKRELGSTNFEINVEAGKDQTRMVSFE